jgi:hypothetical protein
VIYWLVKGISIKVLQWDERRRDACDWSVISLGVPMSPNLVNERMWALIAHGLISTERTRSHHKRPPAFLCTGYSA